MATGPGVLHSSAAAAAAVSAAASLHATSTNPYFPLTINPGCDTKSGSEAFQSRFDPVSESRKQLETCSNVVSSTMEDEDSSSREGLTPLTTVKVRISYVFCTKTQVDNPQCPFCLPIYQKKIGVLLVHDFSIVN